MEKQYRAALYMRLSREDGASESASISAQRKMLRAFACEHGYDVFDEYIDDGVSGTTFDRPEFQRMICDIEKKRVDMVIIKDLSRLGRDYILSGQYTEIYFPSKRVRCIAINDGFDSESPYTDIAPFKNVMNEMYARDISRKIRSSLAAQMREGAFVGAFAPYGYMRDPCDKHRLIVDTDAADTVRSIFADAASGTPPKRIADSLNENGVASPLPYRQRHGGGQWTSATITKMLRSIVYLGHMAQGKTTKVSFKSGISVTNPKEDWYIVENTHEPLVTGEIFKLAGKRCAARTCAKTGTFKNIFSGIAKCADCCKSMSSVGTRKKGSHMNLACGGYKSGGKDVCTNHFIDYDALYALTHNALCEYEPDIAQLTPELLYKYIDRIDVSQGFYDGGKKLQSVTIHFSLSGEKITREYMVPHTDISPPCVKASDATPSE